MLNVKINEKWVEIADPVTIEALRDQFKPEADIFIRNGAPAGLDQAVQDGDQIVFIRRGEAPSAEELESLLVARHTPGVHERIRRATVGIAGLGGLGSAVAVALTRIHVGKLVLVDFDVVEPSNINRQQYFIDQIGLLKTEALAINLRRINPYIELELHALRLDAESVPEVFADVDVLVEAFDAADAKSMILDSFVAAHPEKPLVMASGLAGHGPGGTLLVRKLGKTVYVVGDLTSAAQPGSGLMAPRVGVAAHLQANTVLRLLLGEAGE